MSQRRDSIESVLSMEQACPNGTGGDFLEAGKKRLQGDTQREANTSEVQGLKQENTDLKEVVAELTLENHVLKKSLNGSS